VAVAPLLDLTTDSQSAQFDFAQAVYLTEDGQWLQGTVLPQLGGNLELVLLEEDSLALESHLLTHCSQGRQHSEVAQVFAPVGIELYLDRLITNENVAIDVVAELGRKSEEARRRG